MEWRRVVCATGCISRTWPSHARPHSLIPQSSDAVTQLRTNCSSFYLPRRDKSQSQACLHRGSTPDLLHTWANMRRNAITNWACQTDKVTLPIRNLLVDYNDTLSRDCYGVTSLYCSELVGVYIQSYGTFGNRTYLSFTTWFLLCFNRRVYYTGSQVGRLSLPVGKVFQDEPLSVVERFQNSFQGKRSIWPLYKSNVK